MPLDVVSVAPIDVLFAEELGLIMEIEPSNEKTVLALFEAQDVTCHVIGSSSQVVDSDATVIMSCIYLSLYCINLLFSYKTANSALWSIQLCV